MKKNIEDYFKNIFERFVEILRELLFMNTFFLNLTFIPLVQFSYKQERNKLFILPYYIIRLGFA